MTERDVTVVVLAGGAATRLPRKLLLTIEGEALLARACKTFASYPVLVSGAAPADAPVPAIADRFPRCGPLGGLVSACAVLETSLVYALAADMPDVTPAMLEELACACRQGDEAVVPHHESGIEPLAALYRREALLREGTRMLEEKALSMHELVQRLNARRVPMDAAYFTNINTAADWRAFSASRTTSP